MKKWLLWITGTLLLAALLHVFALQRLPAIVTKRMLANIFNYAENWEMEKVNQLFHGRLRVAGKDKVPMDNPDTVTSFGFYDVSDHPLRIHCVIPRFGSYWSLSFFAWNTDNFFVINDQQIPTDSIDVVIVKNVAQYQPRSGEQVVVSPGAKGVILVRMILRDRNNQEELDSLTAIQKLAFAEVIK